MFNVILPKFIFKVERWKWNSEYRIYVSNTGKFMDEYKKPIPVKINENGYVIIATPYGLKFAHRLVMFTWCPTANMEALTVDHLDHNKRNNAVDNLEWVTKEENCRRAVADFIDFRKKENKPLAPKQIVTVAKSWNELSKNERKKMRAAYPHRYHNPNLTFDDLLFYINGVECPDIDTAIETAHAVFEASVTPGGPGPQLNHWNEQVVRNKFEAMLSRCRHFNGVVIDGEETVCVFMYLHLSVKVKEEV